MSLEKLLSSGEGLKVEFKARFSPDIAKTICAFANTDGGIIFIGVDDRGNVLGVSDVKKVKERLSSLVSSIDPIPEVRISTAEIRGKKVIVVKVKKSGVLHSIGGVTYIRVGSINKPLSLREAIELSAEKLLLSFDRSKTEIPLDEASEELIERFLELRLSRGIGRSVKVEKVLEAMGAVYRKGGKLFLTFAGALAFLENPQQYFPHTYVRIKFFDGWKRIGGSIFNQIEDVIGFIYKNIPEMSSFVGTRRIDFSIFPQRAVREAIVNAVAHRNYAVESEIFVELMPGEIAVKNPGEFPPGVTPENPKPRPRNPVIYELLFQSGYVEKEGSGIEMMKKLSAEAGVDLSIRSSGGFTEVVFRISGSLDHIDYRILNLLAIRPRKSSEIASMLGISKVAVLKRLRKLEKLGKVERVGKGKRTMYVIRS